MTYTRDDFIDTDTKFAVIEEAFKISQEAVPITSSPDSIFEDMAGLDAQLAKYDGSELKPETCAKLGVPVGTKGTCVFYLTRKLSGTTFEHEGVQVPAVSSGITREWLVLKDQGSCSVDGCAVD